MSLEKDLKEFVAAEKEDGGKIQENEDWMKEFSLKDSETVSFLADLTFTEEFLPVLIQVPKSYPSGVYKYTILNLQKTLKAEDLNDAFDQVINICNEKR